jgi:hypothetical protein
MAQWCGVGGQLSRVRDGFVTSWPWIINLLYICSLTSFSMEWLRSIGSTAIGCSYENPLRGHPSEIQFSPQGSAVFTWNNHNAKTSCNSFHNEFIGCPVWSFWLGGCKPWSGSIGRWYNSETLAHTRDICIYFNRLQFPSSLISLKPKFGNAVGHLLTKLMNIAPKESHCKCTSNVLNRLSQARLSNSLINRVRES